MHLLVAGRPEKIGKIMSNVLLGTAIGDALGVPFENGEVLIDEDLETISARARK
jgi:hypothetical protein